MEVFSNVIMTILRAAQGLGIAGATYCFLRVAFKCFWCKESFKDSKNDALAGCIGLVVVTIYDQFLIMYIKEMINFISFIYEVNIW